MRLAVYEDAIYRRDGDGAITVHRLFPLFMAALAREVEAVVQLGRLDPLPGRTHYALPDDVEFVPLPHYPSLTAPVPVLRALGGSLIRFWRVLDRVDAVWLNGPSPMAILFAVVALGRRRRLVLGVRQDTMEYARSRHPDRRGALAAFRMMDRVWRGLARRHPVTAVGAALAAQYPNAHELNVSFVSEADIAPDAPEWGTDEVRVLSVGRLETEKNPLLLADILGRLVAGARAHWRLVVVGEGELLGALEARLDELGVRDHAELLGYLPMDAGLMDVYRSASAFLHVSWTEGLPQVLLEAFAARLPTVATDVGGVGALASGAALLIPPGDAEAAAAGLERLAAEPALRARLSEEAAMRVRERTQDAELRRLAALLRGQ